jgi:hypothetical protein
MADRSEIFSEGRQTVSFIMFDRDKLKLTPYGIPCYCFEDRQREFIKISLDPNQANHISLIKCLEEADNFFHEYLLKQRKIDKLLP